MNENKPDSHGKGIDILIKGVKEENGLNNHVIHSVNIELDLGSAVAVS